MMRILMIAPQPFMEERGAPFAVYHHIKALLTMGFEVDLVAYHLGKAVNMPGLTIYRVPALLPIRQIKVGPSLAKIPLDLLLFGVACWRMCRKRYTCLHTHEEAGLIGVVLGAIFGVRHLYYMHSVLSQQMVSSAFSENSFLLRLVKATQTFIIKHADAIIAICPDIRDDALKMAKNTPVYLIENVAVDEGLPQPHPAEVARLRASLQPDNGPVLLYTGTLESYQGVDLLLQSLPLIHSAVPAVRCVIVGGRQEQITSLQALAQQLGVADVVQFIGQRPLAEIPLYMAMADILVSPRSKGTNTPLKLYTYLRSGKPILATEIYSQTQVLSPAIAMLVPPTPEGLAQGALHLLRDPAGASLMGLRGQQFAQEHCSWRVFLEKATQVQREFASESIVPLSDESKQEVARV